MKKTFSIHLFLSILLVLISNFSFSQLKWENVDAEFQPLPASVHVYKSTSLLDGKPNIAYYVEADLKDKKLDFTVDTTYQRRLSPSQFYEKNKSPLLVVNTTFFSFQTNQSLNVVIKNKKLVGYNIHSIAGKGKDTLTYRHVFGSAIGISRKREADVTWVYSDSSKKKSYWQPFPMVWKDSLSYASFDAVSVQTRQLMEHLQIENNLLKYPWKMKTAVGGGPVLLQNGEINITNNEELKFAGKAIDDKHPRTAMGYTKDNKLIILVIEGRNPGIAEGASLLQEAQIFKNLGCKEALNLDGGGSSCLLVNGKETIKVSDKTGQRPVPAVFIIKQK